MLVHSNKMAEAHSDSSHKAEILRKEKFNSHNQTTLSLIYSCTHQLPPTLVKTAKREETAQVVYDCIFPDPNTVASWSNGRHLDLGSGGSGFKSWLCQVDVESLGKALYMHFLTPLMCITSTQL